MKIIAALDSYAAGQAVSDTLLIIASVCGFALFLAWIVFPFLVVNGLGKIRDEMKRQTKLLDEIATRGRPVPAPKPPSSVRYTSG